MYIYTNVHSGNKMTLLTGTTDIICKIFEFAGMYKDKHFLSYRLL